MNQGMTRADRRGFGTTATLVLVILGIAMFILVVQQMMSSGTSISIGRAYATAHILRVGRMALDEAFMSKKGRDIVGKTLVKGLTEAARQLPGAAAPNDTTPEGRDQLIRMFLGAIYQPTGTAAENKLKDLFASLPENQDRVKFLLAPGAQNVEVKGAYWVRGGKKGGNGNVQFDADDAFSSKYKPETLDLAYKNEIENGTLKVEDVQLRVVAFRHAAANTLSSFALTGQGEAGEGLVRGRVKLRWVLPREVEGKAIAINRTMVEDRIFTLRVAEAPIPPATQVTKEWALEFRENEWQRGASE